MEWRVAHAPEALVEPEVPRISSARSAEVHRAHLESFSNCEGSSLLLLTTFAVPSMYANPLLEPPVVDLSDEESPESLLAETRHPTIPAITPL